MSGVNIKEFDAHGWNQIHRAAHGGFILEVNFNLSENKDLLELETKDDKLMTPFLCAVDGNRKKAVEYLLENGVSELLATLITTPTPPLV
jgi:ankyrin repeat protein